jgi:hypothetical protein
MVPLVWRHAGGVNGDMVMVHTMNEELVDIVVLGVLISVNNDLPVRVKN